MNVQFGFVTKLRKCKIYPSLFANCSPIGRKNWWTIVFLIILYCLNPAWIFEGIHVDQHLCNLIPNPCYYKPLSHIFFSPFSIWILNSEIRVPFHEKRINYIHRPDFTNRRYSYLLLLHLILRLITYVH